MTDDTFAREEIVGLVTDMTRRLPDLQPILDEHRRAQFGQVLPYVFLAETVDHLMDLVEKGDRVSLRQVQNTLDFMEDAFAKAGEDRAMLDLIVGGFLENFPLREERGADLRELLGPRLRKRLSTTYGVGD